MGRKKFRFGKTQPLDQSWMKYTRCFICDRRMCVNNYADRKVRVSKHKVLGFIICPYCSNNGGTKWIQFFSFTLKRSRKECRRQPTVKPCKCHVHVARRLVQRHLQSLTPNNPGIKVAS